MSIVDLSKARVDTVVSLCKYHTIDVLRLDLVHPVISGNKWFKLKNYLQEAVSNNKKIIVSFGGAFSNHILATAAAASANGLKSIGIIRGEKTAEPSPTLVAAMQFGMELIFISRSAFHEKKIPAEIFVQHHEADLCFIPEGGYGNLGAMGAAEILLLVNPAAYTHIIAAVGTGTMLAGLSSVASKGQSIVGISVLKNNFSLQQEVEALIPLAKQQQFSLLHNYHFGGYAKYRKELIDFMNEWYRETSIPSDFVYTGKLFFAVNDLIEKNHFARDSRLLVIHSGGLQGNRSLSKGTLIF